MATTRDDSAQKASALAARGKYKKALALYIKANDSRGAASMYEKLGDTRLAIEFYAKSGEFTRAGELLSANGQHEEAAQMFAKAGSPLRAAKVLVDAQKFKEAGRMYERAGEIEEAARVYEKAGSFGTAAKLFEKCGRRDKAISIYEENDRKELAARLCAQTGDFARAAKLYSDMDIHIEAASCYSRAGMKEEAIDAYERAGAMTEAVTLCEELGLFERAAQLCETLKQTERAADYFAKAEKFASAGRIYEQENLFFQAARMYSREKSTLTKAAELFRGTYSSDSEWEYESKIPVWDIAIAEEAGRVALGLAGAEVVVLDNKGEFLWRFRVPMGVRCRSVAILPNASRLAVGTQGRSVYMLDASNRLLWKREFGGEVRGLSFADNGEMLVAGCTDGYVRVLNPEGRERWSYQADFKIWHAAVHDGKRQIVAGAGDGQLLVFDYEGQVTWKENAGDWVSRVAISPNGQYVAVTLGQDKLRLYDLEDRLLLWEYRHEGVVQDATFWTDSRLLVTTNREVLLLDFEQKILWRDPSADRIMRVRCGSDGETVYFGHYERGLHVVRIHDCVIRAARCYEQAKNYAEAAVLYEEKNELTTAAEMYAKSGAYEKAGVLAEKLENLEKAGEYYEKAGKFVKAAACFESVNLLERAAICYDQAGQKSKAGQLLAGLGETLRAAEMQLQSGDYVAAGSLFEQGGALDDAQSAYEKAVEKSTLTPTAAVGLGRIYLTKGRLDDLIKLLQPFRRDPKQGRKVAELLAECFVKKNQFNIAIDHYREALAGEEDVTADNVDTFYGLGSTYEMAGIYDQAKQIFKKILLLDYYYRDVTGRLERINEISGIFASSTTGTFAGGIGGPANATVAMSGGPGATMAQANRRRYEVVRKLGEGGMGVVYEARDSKLDRIVALKVLPTKFNSNNELKTRFIREARAVAALSHRNVVNVFDIGEEMGESYIAMEYVNGPSLRD
ncbi:MAG: PQQ-binding-like beta-propeller repeat protein, partial [Candidatus Hydrogenedentota bacterium]